MKTCTTLPLATLIPLLAASAHAEVTLDGSLGRPGALPGPNYQIGADLGQQHGGNLFHSFRDFNLQSHESATFSGPANVQNIISRVTGGNPSSIDGTLRSTIPNADMYFLNPYGILFGPNAKLDVQGSFHASTAHYLRLQDGGRFEARQPQNSLLTVAPVEAFGFLDNSIGTIFVTGHGEVNGEWKDQPTGLRVSEGKTLSLIGGDLTLSKGTFFQTVTTQNNQETTTLTELPSLSAPFGRINLASVAQAGEILPRPTGLDLSHSLSATTQLGNLTLAEHSLVDVSGQGGGSIFIRAGQFLARDSRLWSNTQGSQNGGKIDIQAHTIALMETARINAHTEGEGHGTDVNLRATESITMSSLKNGKIDSQNRAGIDLWSGFHGKIPSEKMGDGGNVLLEAKDIEFKEAGHIDNITYSGGKGGDVTVRATNSVTISGKNSPQDVSGFGLMSFGQGHGGNLLIEANNIFYEGETETIVSPYGTGKGGNLTLHAQELLSLRGTGKRMGMGSRLYTANFFGQGNAGNIYVTAKDIVITDGAMLNASSFNSGNAGNIEIHATGIITVAGADQLGVISQIATKSNAENEGTVAGKGGDIFIEAGELVLKDGGQIATGSMAGQSRQSQDSGNLILQIKGTVKLSGVNPYGENATGFGSGIYATSRGLEGRTGKAGSITLQAENLVIEDGAVIKTSTNNDAPGGNLQIDIKDTVRISGDASQIPLKPPALQQLAYLQNFSPSRYNQSTSGIYASSEGTSERAGPSGNLELSAKHLTVTNKGQISTASAGGGKAGQLQITATEVQLEKGAFIGSESQLPNTYSFANRTDRDNQILVTGDVIEVADVGNGKSEQYVYTGTQLLRINPLSAVADLAALQDLSRRYSVNTMGEIMEVKNAGNGQAARFFFKNGNWLKVKEESVVTLANLTELDRVRNQFDPERMPYQEGQAIHVTDAGNGKSADFIFLIRKLGLRDMGFPIRVKSFFVSESGALAQLGTQVSLQDGDLAKVGNSGEAFVYQDQTWIKLNPARVIANRATLNTLILAQAGNIAQLTDGGEGRPASFIYSGTEWMPLGQVSQVADLAQRDKLSAQPGDVVKVTSAEEGKPGSFFYINGHWQERVHGGETGTISLQTQDLRVTNSAITTEAISAGGGSINLKTDKLVLLDRGQITTSVQGGLEKGGNIVINHPTFMVLNQGQVKAQADEGQGGNIHIVAQQFLKTPQSLISASSRVGLDGKVQIDSPYQNIGDSLVASPKEFIDVSGLLPRLCERMSFEEFLNRSTFYVYPIAGSSLSPYDLKPSHAFRSFPKLPTAGQATVSKERRAGESQRLAWLTGCHS
jgi:filamentous hemagglutinin family protein